MKQTSHLNSFQRDVTFSMKIHFHLRLIRELRRGERATWIMIMSGNEVGLRYLKIERSLVNFVFRNESFIDRIVQILAGRKFHLFRCKKKRNRKTVVMNREVYIRFLHLQEMEYLYKKKKITAPFSWFNRLSGLVVRFLHGFRKSVRRKKTPNVYPRL